MDNNQVEVAALKKATELAPSEIVALDDLELCLVGGGVGEITTY